MKVLEALNVIKKTCEETEDCDTCLLRNPYHKNSCGINDCLPVNWLLKDESESLFLKE